MSGRSAHEGGERVVRERTVPAWMEPLRPGPDSETTLAEGWAQIEAAGGIALTAAEFRELLDHMAETLKPGIEVLKNRVLILREALVACEETLRLIHNAAGPIPEGSPMPTYSTFQAWKMAAAALADEHPDFPTPAQHIDPSSGLGEK